MRPLLPSVRRRRTGFTLVELLVSTIVMAIILAAVAGAFVAVQASFQAESQIKSSVEGGRTGVAYLERVVQMAGYGLDPRHAFSMTTTGLPGATKDNRAEVNPAFVTDDLAFRYRDPAYLRRGTLSTLGALTLTAGSFGVALPAGQALLVICPGGGDFQVVKVPAGAGVAAAATSTSGLLNYGSPFTTSTASCLTTGGADAPFVTLLHELRLRLRNVAGRPYLVAYRNLAVAPPGTDADYDPIIADVEDFQVAYVMNRPPPSGGCCSALAAIDPNPANADWVLGDHVSDPLPSEATTPAPTFKTAYDNAARYNLHPANIRMVRISLTVRSSRAEPTKRKAFVPRTMENHVLVDPVADGYYRSVMTTTIRVPNLTSRAFFTPPLRSAAGGPDLNSWGG